MHVTRKSVEHVAKKYDIKTDAMLQIYRKDTASIQDNKFKIHLRVLRLYLQSAKLSNDVP